jgi:hypothetical protein
MRLANIFLAAAVLASPTQISARDGGQGKVPPYYYYIMENCPGKSLEVTLKSGQKLSGRCHAQLADRFQMTHKGVTHDIPYTSIETINVRRRWIGRLKDAVVAPYVRVKVSMGMVKIFNDFHF